MEDIEIIKLRIKELKQKQKETKDETSKICILYLEKLYEKELERLKRI